MLRFAYRRPWEKDTPPEESLRLTDRFTLSQLWVLGAYEMTRTIDKRVKKIPKLLTKRLGRRVLSTKKALARVRMPLAKFEPASAHCKTDFFVAHPAMHRELGISWRIAKRIFVPRRHLSDKLLALLGAIQLYQDRKASHLTLRSIGRAKARQSESPAINPRPRSKPTSRPRAWKSIRWTSSEKTGKRKARSSVPVTAARRRSSTSAAERFPY